MEVVVASMCLDGLRKTTKKSQGNPSPSWDLYPLPAEHEEQWTHCIGQCHNCPKRRYQLHILRLSCFQLRISTNSRRQTTEECNVCKLLFVIYRHLCKARWKLNGKYLTFYISFQHTFLAATLFFPLLTRLIITPLPLPASLFFTL